ncbi:siderophore-interacting protein [Streptomyces gilvosporeus]|uniref:NADPH-dependent ferric siderophore reductase n=1 Tax=Streptomyces gilvosporeus TaxID=553510 RepID=A0A1V0TN08_9ACTN|nr:siderophore-interacting protein [Streptomyces gilvosporeus]ARF54042.1 NADPH-dependent ferric siderophore reductase [Streptomyces gilvosporeus]
MTHRPAALLHVTDVRRITPRMVRVTFAGDGLDDFPTWPDQQLKLLFPKPGQTAPRLPQKGADDDPMRWYQAFLALPEDERPWMRSYTVRSYDAERHRIAVDFVLHGPATAPQDDAATGPATRWAAGARVGDTLARYGPDALYATPLPLGEADVLLLAGDETALPAIGSLVESLPPGARALAYIEVADAGEEQSWVTRADFAVHWVHRNGPANGHGEGLLSAVRGAVLPAGRIFAWLAGEAGTVRALRRHLVEERGLAKRQIEFTGYWRRALTQDDAPTEEDLAEAREKIAAAGTQAAG